MTPQLEEYILDHIDREPDNLRRLSRDVNVYLLYPRMCSGHLQGRILRMLTAMAAPQRVLELGTYAAYSALCIAEGLPPGGHLHTIEIDDEMEDFIRQQLDSSPYGNRVTLHIGDALTLIPTLGDQPWDMVFIDANKRTYVEYYEMILPRLRPGGYIVADNTLWDGKVTDPQHNHDAQSRGIMAFNDLVAADNRVEKVILPLRDGLTIIRKKDHNNEDQEPTV
ncbi:MAG: O-methyltransferase [Muribaculaceae bacterium]|nr:O-methyltransferase [Muribaculaceae bacterium]